MKEENYTGLIILAAIGIMIGAGLIPTIASYIGTMTNTESITNSSITLGAVDTWVDIPGQNLLSVPTVNNITYSGSAVNVTFREAVSTSTGTLRVQVKANNATWATQKINVTYTFGQEGYIKESAGRSIALIILVFGSLLIMVVALSPVLRSRFLEIIGY